MTRDKAQGTTRDLTFGLSFPFPLPPSLPLFLFIPQSGGTEAWKIFLKADVYSAWECPSDLRFGVLYSVIPYWLEDRSIANWQEAIGTRRVGQGMLGTGSQRFSVDAGYFSAEGKAISLLSHCTVCGEFMKT